VCNIRIQFRANPIRVKITGRPHVASLVIVSVFFDASEALVARSMLEARGLVAVLPDYHYTAIAWHHRFAVQGARLCTLDSMAEEARALLPAPAAQREVKGQLRYLDLAFALVALVIAGIPHPVRRR